MSDTVRVCRLCRFWCEDASYGNMREDDGECRRRAPSIVLAHSPRTHALHMRNDWSEGADSDEAAIEATLRVFPTTKAADWCGEWQPDVAGIDAWIEAVQRQAGGEE